MAKARSACSSEVQASVVRAAPALIIFTSQKSETNSFFSCSIVIMLGLPTEPWMNAESLTAKAVDNRNVKNFSLAFAMFSKLAWIWARVKACDPSDTPWKDSKPGKPPSRLRYVANLRAFLFRFFSSSASAVVRANSAPMEVVLDLICI